VFLDSVLFAIIPPENQTDTWSKISSILMKKLSLLFGAFCLIGVAKAQGGPPLLTDDPGTVEKGKWELNLAWINRQMPGATENELPHFDANRGISDRAHLKIEVPWVFAASGGNTINGDGGGSVGIKYRFIDAEGHRPSVSTYPQLGFSLSRRSTQVGISEPGTSLLMPIQVQWDFERFSLNMDSGLVVQAGTNPGWLGGIAVGRKVRNVELLAELHGEGIFATHESNWIAQLGLRREFNEQATLLFAFGRTISASNSDRLGWTSYLGIQLHF
jgi:hypothetical protein